MEEMILIPKKELPQDVAFYKGELTGNAWLNRASQLAAAKKRVLQDPTLTDEEIVQKVKPLGRHLLQANKKLRQIPGVGVEGEEAEDEGGDLVTTNVEKWLRRLAMGMTPGKTPKTPKTPQTLQPGTGTGTPRARPTPKPRTQRTLIPPTPKPRTPRDQPRRTPSKKTDLGVQPSTPSTFRGALLEGALDNLLGSRETTPPRRRTLRPRKQKGKGLLPRTYKKKPDHWLPY